MNTKNKKLIISIFWILVAFPLVLVGFIMIFISMGWMGFMPSFEHLENPQSNLASEIYSTDQQLLGKYYLENRTIVNFEELSPNLVYALMATEDIRFKEHPGIDFRSLGRVLFKTLILGQKTGGGSTITQQLAKNLFARNTDENIVIIKFKEWITAIKLERNYTKDEIMAMYFNTVPFGSGAYGVNSASRIFFNKTPDSLKIEEAALLVGIVNAPTRYSPLPPLHKNDSIRIRRQERSWQRRNLVLTQMEKYEVLPHITHAQWDSLRALPITLNFRPQSHYQGSSTYFREFLRQMLTATEPKRENYGNDKERYSDDSLQWATNPLYGWCNKNFKPDGTPYNIYQDGLKIYSTVDSRMQQYAEESVTEHMGKAKDGLQAIFQKEMKWRKNPPFSNDLTPDMVNSIMNMFIKNSERYRVARVNGLTEDQIKEEFKRKTEMRVFTYRGDVDTLMTPLDSVIYYNSFLRAGFISIEPQSGYVKAYVGGINFEHFKYDHVNMAKRQVGSTFKPFLYTMAMIDGLSPCYKVANIPWYFDPVEKKPAYSKNNREGEMVTLKYGLALSLNQISAWLINKYGPANVVKLVKKMGIHSYVPEYPSICVGSPEITLAEMVGAYGTYTNKGIYTEPIYVTRIEDKNGNVISTFTPKKNVVISEQTAYLMVDLMKSVVDYGTSTRLRHKYGLMNEIAGKTGTTNSNSDGWFIGSVPNLVSGGWVGGEVRSIRFTSTDLGQGANMALPIWGLFMQKCYADKGLNISKAPFPIPDNVSHLIDCAAYDQMIKEEESSYNTTLDDEEY